MNGFKLTQPIKSVELKPGEPKKDVPLNTPVKLGEADSALDIRPFDMPKIEKGPANYTEVKARFGPLASSDVDRRPKSRKDVRFEINPYSKSKLSIEEQDRQVIEEKVHAKIQELEAVAYKEGHDQGYKDGLEKGREEAFAQFKAEGDAKVAQLDSMVKAFEELRGKVFQSNERYLIELTIRMAKMIVLRELKTDPEYVARLAKHLVERVGVRENIRIKVNPDDLKSTALIREGLEASFGNLKNLTIQESSQVETGGCILETDWNAINATVEQQLLGLEQGLMGENPEKVPGET